MDSNMMAGQSHKRRRNQSPSPPRDGSQKEDTRAKRHQAGDSENDRRFVEHYNQKTANDRAEKERREKQRVERANEDEADRKARMREFQANYKAESTRREALSPQERLKEDGQELQQKIEADPAMVVALERSSSERAKCRAGDDCLHRQINRYGRVAITDEYRICMHGVENQDWFGRTKHYYHLGCFSRMVNLIALVPSRFKMDGAPGSWPLMVEKWFQYKGCIDLNKIASYIDQQDAYIAAMREYSCEEIGWQLAHSKSCIDKAKCECKLPQRPTAPSKPRLKNCTAGERNISDLGYVLKHPGCRYVHGFGCI